MSPLEEFAKNHAQQAAQQKLLKMIDCLQSDLDDIAIVPGQWILCTDTKEYYNDVDTGVRIKISDTIQLDTEADRSTIIPINGKALKLSPITHLASPSFSPKET